MTIKAPLSLPAPPSSSPFGASSRESLLSTRTPSTSFLNGGLLASKKLLENKYETVQKQSDEWYRRAQLALSKGDEELACETLKRRKFYVDDAASLKIQLDQQKCVADNLVSNAKLLENKIHEARMKKDTLKARAQSAKIATKVIELVRNVNTVGSLSAFEKMEENVLAMELQAESLYQLTTDVLEGKFALLEGSSVYDDLVKMKSEISGSSQVFCLQKEVLISQRLKMSPNQEEKGIKGF